VDVVEDDMGVAVDDGAVVEGTCGVQPGSVRVPLKFPEPPSTMQFLEQAPTPVVVGDSQHCA